MKTAIVSILLSLVVGLLVYKTTMMHALDIVRDIQVENENLKIDIQYNEGQAYSDCQRMLQINAKIQKVDGCMRAIEVLCNERTVGKQNELCMKAFMPVCDRLDQ